MVVKTGEGESQAEMRLWFYRMEKGERKLR
jgi:hypothetical protein